MRWTGLGVCVAAAIGCRGLGGTRSLTEPGSDAAAPGLAAPDGGADLGGERDAEPRDAGSGGVTADDAGASQPLCPPLDIPAAAADAPTGSWSPATAVPFSCAPMPDAFYFPRPGPDVPGAYGRCASFADARVTSLAVNGDGSRVALIGIDGVVRVVDVASRAVVGVLAPPRASVDLAAFSSSGDTILTVARGERSVGLWRADTFAPIWTTTLPGHPYEGWGGAAALSPDGTAALVSAGDALYLLDTATGSIRATGSQLGGVALNAAYGWQGRRIAVLTAQVTGMCVYSPHGGAVTVVDPQTLAPIATPMAWPLQGDEAPGPGQLLVAADADLILTSGPETYPSQGPKAFRISDGSALPDPQIATFPLALSPDGLTALMGRTGVLTLVRLIDGAPIASTAAAVPTAAAFSADGTTIAAGSRGQDLLGIWRPAAGPLISTCTADARASDEWSVLTSLSADGAIIAVDWGTQIRVLRRSDGSLLSTIEHAQQTVFGRMTLSPDGRYVIGEFIDLTSASEYVVRYPMAVFRTSDGVQMADLGSQYSFQGGSWSGFAFSSDGAELDGALGHGPDGNAVMQIDLRTGSVSPKLLVQDGPYLMGMSGECPLLSDSNVLVRACGGCQPLPVAKNVGTGVVSLDGSKYLGWDGHGEVTGSALRDIGSQPGVLRSYPPRPEEAAWRASELPVAVSAHGERVITGAREYVPCANTPGFTSRVHDVATDTVIDDLPPGITATSADLAIVAYGPVLWCAR